MPLCISALLLQKEASDRIDIRCKDLKFVPSMQYHDIFPYISPSKMRALN